ncbi:MAG TPA: hypothetical protein VMF06_05025 [Candidatus Limnocylindria bacterium]|jgi:hypothetical protein|nr:hypothetical protein [Candidatus Limnocylindria bacterium]
MTKKIIFSLTVLAGMAIQPAVSAFTMLGPYAFYQTADIGYNSGATRLAREGDAGGPMNRDEGYRWTTPVVTYTFDESFTDYFGAQGVAAVEAAFKVLNDLPAASETDAELSAFPLQATRINTVAAQLGLYDVKSVTLSVLLEILGLGSPERYTYSMHSRNAANNVSIVDIRNFDPINILPSPRVNGTLYTYQVRHFTGLADFYDAQEIPVDTAQPNLSVVAFADTQIGLVDGKIFSALYDTQGFYYTGLSRDDMGGLRYLYNRGSVRRESLPGDVLLAAQDKTGATGVVDIGQGLSSSPWRLISSNPQGATNTTTGTTSISGVSVPYPFGTYITTSTLNAGNTASNAVTQIVFTGKRAGVDKIKFVNVDKYYDPLLMVSTNGYLVTFNDVVVALNGSGTFRQRVGRLQPHADIVISANDLGTVSGQKPFLYGRSSATTAYYLNTSGGSSGEAHSGPGIIDPDATGNGVGASPIEIVFNKLGNYFLNSGQSTQSEGIAGEMWGTFDGSTNAPFVYPPAIDIRSYSRAIFGN